MLIKNNNPHPVITLRHTRLNHPSFSGRGKITRVNLCQ